ncbi:MAG: CrcB family protein [Desulfovibrionales bacterium]|nr:MAG: CrcB family protein [Desulfovibrionales bacterium]
MPDRFPHPLTLALLVGLFGAAGAISRHIMTMTAFWLLGPEFPWGTFLVNVSGCFLFGVLWALSEHRCVIPFPVSMAMLTGFVGSFTTFSSLVFETELLLQTKQWGSLALYLLGQNILGFAALALGLWIAGGQQSPDKS